MALKVAAGLVVFRRFQSAIEFLLLHASYEQNLWSPPKGHVDPGEDEMQTAWRETWEESGLTSTDLRLVDGFVKELNYIAHGNPKRVVYWLAELNNPETPIRLSEEHREFKWTKLEEGKALVRSADLQETLDECHRFLQGPN